MQITLDAASGLLFLHDLRPARIHRDVKSANFLVAEVSFAMKKGAVDVASLRRRACFVVLFGCGFD